MGRPARRPGARLAAHRRGAGPREPARVARARAPAAPGVAGAAGVGPRVRGPFGVPQPVLHGALDPRPRAPARDPPLRAARALPAAARAHAARALDVTAAPAPAGG